MTCTVSYVRFTLNRFTPLHSLLSIYLSRGPLNENILFLRVCCFPALNATHIDENSNECPPERCIAPSADHEKGNSAHLPALSPIPDPPAIIRCFHSRLLVIVRFPLSSSRLLINSQLHSVKPHRASLNLVFTLVQANSTARIIIYWRILMENIPYPA